MTKSIRSIILLSAIAISAVPSFAAMSGGIPRPQAMSGGIPRPPSESASILSGTLAAVLVYMGM